jgi:hypothetical protein
MATLVLTTVGTYLGGPIGGAIGSTIGQYIDREVIFKPAAREGPRLTELAVQTSSYGSPIPQLFGTIRVAGSVIWSTDLIETRQVEGRGKGQAGVNTSSYAASFAVLLSARRIEAVRRIWADGTLIRGLAGDWKTPVTFRLHLGDEGQAVDPLIASAEGALAPAHRGAAYAVFENLALGDYGNRIPSLTFEVVADAAGLSVGAIGAALAEEVDGEAATMLDGFAASGSSVAGVLETLAVIGGAWWRSDGARLAMTDRRSSVVALADRGPLTRRMAGGGIGAVSVAHHDPARDYQRGVQRARRPGGSAREQRIELPAVLPAAAAARIAETLLARSEAARVSRVIEPGLGAIDVVPGAVVSVAGEPILWRVKEAKLEAMRPLLTLEPVTSASAVGQPTTSGRVLGAPDAPAGRTIVHAVELPPLGDEVATAPRVTVFATGMGAGWRRAALLYSSDGGASWVAAGGTALPAITGVVATVPRPGATWLRDEASAIEVMLDRGDMVLGDSDAVRLDGGANLALVGDELVQFAHAEPLGGRRWRLTGLLRGRRGTEAEAAGHVVGERFVLIEAVAGVAIDLPIASIGTSVRVMASGSGDGAPVEAVAAIVGRSVLPPAPVRLRARRSRGMLVVSWIRRSRAGWRWIDGVDAPLVEERELYRVTIEAPGGDRMIETASTAIEVAADGATRVTVRQCGTLGLSPPVVAMVVGEGE